MHVRVIAFLTAAVLLWSGFASTEAPRAFAQPLLEQGVASAGADGSASERGGTVEHHHLDDLPGQSPGDPTSETPGLLSPVTKHVAPPLPSVRPPALVPAPPGSPFLAGLLRPPSDAAVRV